MNSSLDTNVLLRYIWGDVPAQQRKAVKLLSDESQVFYVSDLVVAEVIFNLQVRQVPRDVIAKIISEVTALKNVRISEVITEQILPFYQEHPALSFVDCYAAFMAENDGAEPLWTFDKKLANQHPSAKKV